jgi:hypothetical protein
MKFPDISVHFSQEHFCRQYISHNLLLIMQKQLHHRKVNFALTSSVSVHRAADLVGFQKHYFLDHVILPHSCRNNYHEIPGGWGTFQTLTPTYLVDLLRDLSVERFCNQNTSIHTND